MSEGDPDRRGPHVMDVSRTDDFLRKYDPQTPIGLLAAEVPDHALVEAFSVGTVEGGNLHRDGHREGSDLIFGAVQVVVDVPVVVDAVRAEVTILVWITGDECFLGEVEPLFV